MAQLPVKSISDKYMDVTPLKIKVEGCLVVDVFEVKERGRKQYLFVVGENHSFPGNSLELLKKLTEKTNCPIHVLVEKEYTLSPHTVAWPIPNSNLSVFHSDVGLRNCTDPRKIPSKNLSSPKTTQQLQFFRQCVERFKGNTKIWGIDLRWSGIFHLLYTLTCELYLVQLQHNDALVSNLYHSDPQFRHWLDRVIELQKKILNFYDAIHDPVKYDTEIRLRIKNLFDPNLLPDVLKPFLKLPDRPIQHIINQKLGSKEKSYLTLINKLLKISNYFYMNDLKNLIIPTLNENNGGHLLMWSYIMDLEFIYRINKIVQKEPKEGFIICFVGEQHRRRISDFLRKIPHSPGAYRFEFLQQDICDGRHEATIRIPMIGCTEKTKWMTLYQKKKIQRERLKTQFQEASFRYLKKIDQEKKKAVKKSPTQTENKFARAFEKYIQKKKEEKVKKQENIKSFEKQAKKAIQETLVYYKKKPEPIKQDFSDL